MNCTGCHGTGLVTDLEGPMWVTNTCDACGGTGKAATPRVLAKDMPAQPGDDDPVNPDKPDGPRWGELFGRSRSDRPPG